MGQTPTKWKMEAIRPQDPRAATTSVRQLLQYAAATPSTKGFLWASVDETDKLGAAVMLVPQTGRNGMIFSSAPTGRDGVERLGSLIQNVCLALDPQEIQMAQVLLDPSQRRVQQAYEAAGFWRLARLQYLQSSVPPGTDPPAAPSDGEYLSWHPSLRERFVEALDASYVATLDCPKLHGLRTADEALDAHLGTGQFDPTLWTLLTLADRAAGILLLNPIPAVNALELVYLGLSPQDRGHGLGKVLMERAFWLARCNGYDNIVLALDDQNTPAARLYRALRFHRTDIKDAFVRHLPSST
jgi:ribosomal protein S18 acetylase RimI-like enzyme